MESFSDRLKKVLEIKNLTSSELAEKLNIQRSSISHLLSGRNKPSFDFLSKFTRLFPDIDIKWFITGEGTPYPANSEENISGSEHKTKNEVQDKVPARMSGFFTSPDELIKIFPDGTFEILKRRKLQ